MANGSGDPRIEKHIRSIAKIQLGHLEKRLTEMDMKLEVDDVVLSELAHVGFDPVFGARPLKRAIQSTIENPLAKEMLEGRFGPKDIIRVTSARGKIRFEKGK